MDEETGSRHPAPPGGQGDLGWLRTPWRKSSSFTTTTTTATTATTTTGNSEAASQPRLGGIEGPRERQSGTQDREEEEEGEGEGGDANQGADDHEAFLSTSVPGSMSLTESRLSLDGRRTSRVLYRRDTSASQADVAQFTAPMTLPLPVATHVAVDPTVSLAIDPYDSDEESWDDGVGRPTQGYAQAVPGGERQRPPVWKSTISLCNTIMGTGILSMPYAFATVGVLPGILLLSACAFATWFSLRILVSSSLMAHSICLNEVDAMASAAPASGGAHAFTLLSPGSYPTYGYLARVAFGPKYAAWVDFAMAFGCFGFAVSYLTAIRDCMPRLFLFLLPLWGAGHWFVRLVTDGYFWAILFLLLLIPLALARSVDDFWWFDGACLLSVLYLSAVVLAGALLSAPLPPPLPADPLEAVGMTWKSVSKQLEVLPVFFFAFACQQNVRGISLGRAP